ncbi:hypothetical protein RB195_016892 [Necator americanus]|uniref:Uncharacterized protein n=1 Tax=Necator americanus TaxID=51031 RepID=A0ABR1C2M7_NECAM
MVDIRCDAACAERREHVTGHAIEIMRMYICVYMETGIAMPLKSPPVTTHATEEEALHPVVDDPKHLFLLTPGPNQLSTSRTRPHW